MAALGKIRQRGVILSCIIGLGIFAFIAGDMFRACESQGNEKRQQVGEILDEKISVQQFQKLVDEYTDVIKMTRGENLSEQELNQVKDFVWNTLVQSKLIERETKELGLTVTSEEIRDILQAGTHPALLQSFMGTGFVNQQTGRFDVNVMNKFMQGYEEALKTNPQMAESQRPLYNYCQFVMKSLREQLLQQKYNALLANCMLSNPISAKDAYEAENIESDIRLAAFPYSKINDKDIKITDADIKAKYEEYKEGFKQNVERRDIKYVDFEVVASDADRKAIRVEIDTMASQLAKAADPSEIVRRSGSVIPYIGVPVTKNAFPADIAKQIDSIAVGSTSKVIENKEDNTYNVVRLLSKSELPDSIEFRAINVGGKSVDEARKRADSIYNALKDGADFKTLAKKYGQSGDSTMITTAQYEGAPSMDKDTKSYIEALNTMAVNEVKNIEMTEGNIIIKVTARKGVKSKYVAAVIKKPIDFSKDTYSKAYNKFSSFVSQNKTIEDMEKNAQKFGFTVKERIGISSAEHNIAGLSNTREAMKWLFETEDKGVSPLYECGENNHLLVLALTDIHPEGYQPWDNEQIKSAMKALVMNDKKAEIINKKLAGVKSVDEAGKKGAIVTDVQKITFAAPTFVKECGAAEPALSGRVAGTAKGKFSATPVKGNGGVYMFQVTNKTKRDVKYNEKEYLEKTKMKNMQIVRFALSMLQHDAHIVDHRYLFF